MNIVSGVLAPLSWLGRQGTRAIAASLFVGMALPPLSALAKPILPSTVFLLLTLAMVRIDVARLRAVGRHPGRMALMLVWGMVAVPALGGAALSALGSWFAMPPALMMAIMLMLVAPPIMSVPAFCYILGLNGALSLVLMVLMLIATPLTAPLIAGFVLGDALPLDVWPLALRLAGYLVGSAVLAAILRRVLGMQRISAHKDTIDGLNVFILFLFAVALMDGVAALAWDRPGLALSLIALSFAIAGAITAVTTLVFLPLGIRDALSFGLTCGNRNMGLMASALITGLPHLTWVYFALGQFPIYLLPQIMRPIVRRLGADRETASPH
ncbi:MAG: sodium:proton symporter [Rhodobiaceae bacterium]|nr:sodium:proton symporter [Rhodobiaceae bacterium]